MIPSTAIARRFAPQLVYIVANFDVQSCYPAVDHEAAIEQAGEVVVQTIIEPLGTDPVMNLDFFLPAREDYQHLVKYLETSTK